MIPALLGASRHHNPAHPGFRDPDPLGFAAGFAIAGPVGARIDPGLRGHVEPRIVAYWRRAGWTVHQIGQAVYVHGPDGHRFLVGVWNRRDERPPWAHRLGRPSPGYLRRLARLDLEQRGRWYVRRPDGRFVAKLPWWAVRPIQAYSFDPIPSTIVERERDLEAAGRAALRSAGWWV
jgi:hypothetical protein